MDTENVQIVKEVFFKIIDIENRCVDVTDVNKKALDTETLSKFFNWSYHSVKKALDDQIPDPPAPDKK